MNFLAHLYLSCDSEQIMVGNFLADFVKATETESYQRGICLGILLHREIDSFTNKHHQFAKSKKRLWHRHRHYSSVIVDIFYDHFLAKNWEKYSNIPLEEFAQQAYTAIQRFEMILPQKARRVLPHMIANNWLTNYRKMEGVDRAMQGMARRASFPSEMSSAIEDLQKNYESFENDFREFFPDLTAHSKAFLAALAKSVP
jgi:acyl carrier protein phosphodiesterase